MPRPRISPSPPPAAFAFTAGDFDHPHASNSPPTLPASGNTGLNMRPASRQPHQPAHDGQASAMDPLQLTARRPVSAIRRRQLHRLLGPGRDSELADDMSRRPSTANPNRLRSTPSERYLGRSHARIAQQRAAHMDSTDALLDSLTRNPIHNLFGLSSSTAHSRTHANTTTRPRSPAFHSSTEHRHAKRRKLHHDATTASQYNGFKYGYKGQVVSGRLKMDIVSCDGGEYRKDNPSGLYNVHNVLKNDKSVYCSESASCNLLLKHIGEAPFALDKVVIRAPDRGFTAPVQEGLVFVSMSADQLLSKTAAYQLQYRPSSPLTSPTPSSPVDDDNEQLSLQEAIHDPTIWQRLHGSSSDRRRRPRDHTNPGPYSPVETSTANDVYTENCDDPAVPPFTVTTATEEEDEDEDEEEEEDEDEEDDDGLDSPPSAAIIADRLRRESRWRAESEDDQDDDDDDIIPRFGGLRRAPPLDYTSYGDWRDWRESLRASQLGSPSRIAPVDDKTASGSEDVIAPHARFFIKKNRHKITIKFQPAVSGRHILLKFWSPTHDGNIDIESVQFYGFSGPRFFPSTKMC